MAVLSGKARAALPDSAFAYVEPGKPQVDGKTQDKYRHYPVHDKNHVKAALSRISQGDRFGKEAKSKVMAAAKEHGVEHDEGSETGRSLESLFPEVRFINDPPEFRSVEGGGDPHITGYAAVFGKLSRKLGGFFEVIEPRAFDASRDAGFPGVVCRYNHRDDMLLGTTGGGTLQIDVDERGMKYDVIPPRTRADVLELVQRGDVRFSSFAFRCLEPGVHDTWGTTEWGQPLRRLHQTDVVDCAPVHDPAYMDTSAAARSMIGAEESLARWVNAPLEEVRSHLAAGQASKFFRRTDRPSTVPAAVPSLAPSAADEREIRMLDDSSSALRSWRYADEAPAPAEQKPSAEPATEERDRPTEAELRAAMKTPDQLCYRYTHGEPCVRPSGHEGDCKGVCWSRVNGLPCNKVQGHEDEHAPMPVSGSRSADEGAETRGAGDETAPGQPEVPEATPEVPEAETEVPAERKFDLLALDAELIALKQRQLAFEALLND